MLQVERRSVVDGLSMWLETFIRFLRHHPQPGWELEAFTSLVLQLGVLQSAVGLRLSSRLKVFPHPFSSHLAPHHEFQAWMFVGLDAEFVSHEQTVAICSY